MFSLVKRTKLKTEIVEDSPLEDMLATLQRYGSPSCSHLTRGWHASVDMHVESTGANFTIRSEYDHDSPREATFVCITRVQEALAKLKA